MSWKMFKTLQWNHLAVSRGFNLVLNIFDIISMINKIIKVSKQQDRN